MADNTQTAPSTGHGRGGGRRRGRGGAPPSGRSDEPRNTGDGASRGGKSRGRGGRGSGGRDKQRNQDGPEAPETQPTPKVATATVGTKEVPAATDDADDGEICFICASTVEHTSVSPCNHRTCHICALRLRALYKNRGCAHCRVYLLLAISVAVVVGFVANNTNLAHLYRLSLPLSSSPMIRSADSKTLKRKTLLGPMRTWEFIMRRMKSLKTPCCCCDTTAPMKIVMSPVLDGRTCIVM